MGTPVREATDQEVGSRAARQRRGLHSWWYVQDGGIVTRLDVRAGVWRKVWDGTVVWLTQRHDDTPERVVTWTGARTATREKVVGSSRTRPPRLTCGFSAPATLGIVYRLRL